MEARFESLETRIQNLETIAVSAFANKEKMKKEKKYHHNNFVLPADINKNIFTDLVAVRKEIYNTQETPTVNFAFSNKVLCEIIRRKITTYEELEKIDITCIDENNKTIFGRMFIDVMKKYYPDNAVITAEEYLSYRMQKRKRKSQTKSQTKSQALFIIFFQRRI